MATVIDELITVLSFRGDATGIQNTRTRIQGMSQDVAAAARGFGILGGAIVAAGAGALSQFIPFEDQIAKIRGLVGVSNEELDGMVPRIHKIGAATGVGPDKLADALFRITSNGLRGAEAMDVLERSANAQAIGLGDAAVSANVATSAINAYGSENLTAAQIFDQLTAGIRLGNLETDQLAGSIDRLLPTTSALGIEFHEITGLMSAMSRTGTDANQSVTQLGQVMFTLLQPSVEAEDVLARFGFTARQLREHIGEHGLLQTLELLRNSFGDNDEAIGDVFGNIRAFRGVIDLLGPNLSVTQEIMADMADTTGELDGAFERSETRGRDLRRTMAQLQSGAILLGNALAPIVDMVVGPLTAGIRRFTELLDSDNVAVQRVAQAVFIFGGILLGLSGTLFAVAGAMRVFAFSIAPVTGLVSFLRGSLILLRVQLLALAVQQYATAAATWLLNAATTSLTLTNIRHQAGLLLLRAQLFALAIAQHATTVAQWALNIAMYANPVGLIILGIVALIAILVAVGLVVWKFRDAIMDGLGAAWNWIKDNWPLLLALLIGPFGLAVFAIWKYRDEIIAIIMGLVDKIKEIWEPVGEILGNVTGGVRGAVGSVGGVLGFAEGGVVPGPTGQPRAAIVHGGEGIFSVAMMRRLSMGPEALAPALPPPVPAYGGAGRSFTVEVGGITVHVGAGADGDEIAATVSRVLADQLNDLVTDTDGPIER